MAVFTDKVIIVTGASEGIGRALCLALAPQGPKLVLASRNKERLDELAGEVEAAGAKALVIPTDVTDEDQCKALIDKTVEELGAIDALVNNAGQTMWTRMEDIEDTSIFEKLTKLNYLAAIWLTYYALPHLKKSKGRIVCVSSIAGLLAGPTRTAYAGSKHAMFGFFDSLRIELIDTGVTVTMVAPGFVYSNIHVNALDRHGNRLGESPMEKSKYMPAETCAAMMVDAMEKRKRLLVTDNAAKLGRWLKLIAPGLLDRLAIKTMEKASKGQSF
jgi:short-subunit dehydrogenase